MALVVLSAVVSLGCASNKGGAQRAGDVYKGDAVGKYLMAAAAMEDTGEYVIGIGDRLDVVFFVHKDLSQIDLLVRNDGRITVPYVGDVVAAGLTPMGLDSTLTVAFSEVLRDPNLSVIVRQPAEKMVYVLGQVHSPGGFPYDLRVSVVQALALAGGMDRGAKTSHVLVIRREGLDRVVGIEINVAAITGGHNMRNDIWLKNYDIVYVPKTRLQSAGEFMEILNDVLFPPVDLVLRGWTIQVLQTQLELLRAQD